MPTVPSRIPRPRTPRVGRPDGRFTQHRRIDKLIEVLESEPRGLTLAELATMLRMTQRSVRRYLRELDGTTELESIATTPGGAHLWRIKPSERGRAVALRRSQAYAILAARRALEVLRGSALYDEVDLALGHIEKVAQTPFRASGKSEISGERDLGSRFFVLPPAHRTYAARGEDLDELFRAVADLRVLRFRPRARPPEPRPDRVVFHPYAMIVHKGAIAVLGAQAGAKDVEVVAFETMTEIRASESEHFELPPSFDVESYLHGEFGLARPERRRAVVEFDARVADDVKSKRWSPAQRLATAPDGRVRLSLPLVNLDALVGWVLSWGDAAQVVEPAELAQRVAATLERARARYR